MVPLIEMMIVGAQKAGTTSLLRLLSSHPMLTGHDQIECSFFTADNEYNKGYDYALKHYFKERDKRKIIAKNVTLGNSSKGLERLQEHNAHCKIVFIMRNPVSRAYSSYNMAVKDGWMSSSLDDLCELVESGETDHIMYRHFLEHGIYKNQLERISTFFNPEQIRIYLFESFVKNQQGIIDEISDWLGVQSYSLSNEKKQHNKTTQPRSMFAARVLNELRRNDNMLKRSLKSVLPPRYFSKIGRIVKNAASTKARFDPMNQRQEQVLKSFYTSKNAELYQYLKDTGLISSVRTDLSDSWLNTGNE